MGWIALDTALAFRRAFSCFSIRARSAAVWLAVCVSASAPAYGQAGSGQLLDASWMAQANPDGVRALLHGGADLAARDADGRTALHHAMGNPNVRVLETLLEYGADPNVADFAGGAALESAAGRADRQEHALALVRFGARYEALDATVRGGLGLASTAEALADLPVERLLGSDWAEFVSADRLQALAAFGDNEDEALEAADLQSLFRRVLGSNRDPAAALFLIGQGAELGFADGVPALHVAAGNANPSVARALLDLEDPEVPVDEADGNQRTALHVAAGNENPAVARLLLERGADVNAEDGRGRRALHVAAGNANPAVAGLLLERGAELAAQDADGRRALHEAALHENPAVAELLLEAGADVNAEDERGQTALALAVDQGNSGVLETLRDGGDWSAAEVFMAVGEQSRQAVAGLLGEVPQALLNLYLRVSLLNPDAGVARLLLERGAEGGPVSLAALNANPAVVRLLLERGAEVGAQDAEGRTALHVAALNANPAVAGLLLEADVNAADADGRRALHVGALNTNPAVVQALLEAGAEVGAQDAEGYTALHVAAGNENPAVAQALLEAGADVNAADADGRRALHFAAGNANPAVAQALLEAGADMNARDAGQATALTLAWLNPRSAVPAALLRAGAEVTALEDRLLDSAWLGAASAPELLAQVANALPSALRRRDEECGRAPVHLLAHFAARNNLDPRLLDLDPQLTAGGLGRIDHRSEGFRVLLEREVSVQDVDANGNGVLHYAVSGAAKVGQAVAGQAFPSAGLGVLQDLRELGADGRLRGAASLWPIHYAQPGRAFAASGNALLADVLERWFGVPGNVDPATNSAEDRFLPETDACVVLGASAERTSPADLAGR